VARTLAAIDMNGSRPSRSPPIPDKGSHPRYRDLAYPAKRVQLGELRICFDGMHRRLDDARSQPHSL